jgi:hypothetical protein
VDAVMLAQLAFSAALLCRELDVHGAPELPPARAQALLVRMMSTEAFVGSDHEEDSRGTTGRYFTRAEYQRLRGNPLLGYWDIGGFSWVGGARVGWRGIRASHPSARPIPAKAWATAFRLAVAKNGLEEDAEAHVQVEGGCVAAAVDASADDPVPGVLIELRVKSPTGALLYRVSVGKPTVEDAMGAALDLVLRFGRALPNRGGEGGRGAAR